MLQLKKITKKPKKKKIPKQQKKPQRTYLALKPVTFTVITTVAPVPRAEGMET